MLYRYLEMSTLENPKRPAETFYEDCHRLPQGHWLRVSVNDLSLEIKQYYDVKIGNGSTSISEEEAVEQFTTLFKESVARRLRSDVPVGSSLSGGLDSSSIVCTINDLLKKSNQVQKTFSAVFPGFEKDESKYISRVTSSTSVEPHFVTPTGTQLEKDLNKLFFHQEEPFGSTSVYVQYSVMRLARENGVTVLLDGQGADEMLAGYHHYFPVYHQELKRIDRVKYRSEKKAFEQLINHVAVAHNTNKGIAYLVGTLSPKLLGFLRSRYHSYKSSTLPKHYTQAFMSESAVALRPGRIEVDQNLNRELYASIMQIGLHELLRYADRNSMAHSREVRLPFLSHHLVDFVFTLPAHYKIRDAWTKWILRKSMSGLVPSDICWRKDKIGYEPPQKSWMESTSFKEKVRASQELLVKNDILEKNVLNIKIQTGGVGKSALNSWSHLSAGMLFS